jgi:carboxylesterase type B
MPWLLTNWKMILGGFIVIVSFTAGWVIKGAFDDSAELAAQKAREALIKELRDNEAHIANILERKLQELKANEKTIIRERTKLVDRPVYHNNCMDADGVQLVEQARSGKAKPAKSTSEVSGTK